MAFTSVLTGFISKGNKKGSYGTYANAAGSTGGDINTGLDVVDSFSLIPNQAAVAANQHVLNETLPAAGSAITIVTGANEGGNWEAVGN